MKQMYPYRSRHYHRSEFWWDRRPDGSPGDWAIMSTWCNTVVGPGNWEFFYNQFVFEREADLIAFLLRWE